jgi:hypothetical protein
MDRYRVVRVNGTHHKIQCRFLWVFWVDTIYYSFNKLHLNKICERLNNE